MPMNVRALIRRAFPYLLIAIIGFALAYVVVFVFVLPTKIVPPKTPPYHPDSSQILLPIDPSMQETQNPVTLAPPVGSFIPPPPPIPVDVPDLVGMALPDARGVLNTLQLNTVVHRDTSSLQPPGTVLRQSPEPGAKVSEHGTVTVTASYFPPVPDSSRAPDTGSSAGIALPGSTPNAPSDTIVPPPARQPLPPIQPEPDTESAPLPQQEINRIPPP
jgi:hypothetical protein